MGGDLWVEHMSLDWFLLLVLSLHSRRRMRGRLVEHSPLLDSLRRPCAARSDSSDFWSACVSGTYDDDAADSLEEHLRSRIQGSDGTPTPLTPSEVEVLREHVRSGHLKKSHLCKPCMEAEGPVRRHVSHSKKRAGVAHIDICGPLPLSWEGHRYILVLGLRLLDDAPLLISARGLATRTSVEVTAALGEMIDEFEGYDLTELPLSNGKRILTIQSDRAREFESRNFTEFCRARGLTHSETKGYDPAANGTAERVVGLIKSGLRKLLASTAFPASSWGYLLRYLVQSHFVAAIGREQTSLPPGTLVIARTLASRPSLEPRGVVGRLLFHDHLHDGSSYLLMDEDVVRCGYPVACPEDRNLKWTLRTEVGIDPNEVALLRTGLETACELDAVNLLSGITTSQVGDPLRKLEDDLGVGSAKVRDRTSPTEDVDDAESHEKGMALLPENSMRKVEDGQLELEDVLGVASAKVRDRTSLDDHAADPRVAEPASKGAADEPPVDKSLLVDAGEIRRIFRSNDPRKEKWDAGIRKELKALTEDTPCLVPLTPKQRQVAETKARTEGKPVQRVPSKLVFAIKTDGRFRVRLVACGNHCAEVLGCVSTSELDGVLLRFMLSWEAAQRSQGSAGRTVEKVDVSNAFINSDLPENRLVLIDPPSLLISLGYLPQGTVWVAKRAIYGLRESPALWAATRNKEMAKLTLGNGLLLRPSRTHAALWFLYSEVDKGTRPGQPDENGELVTPEGVYHYKTYVKPLGMIGVYVDDILGVGLAKAVRVAMEQIRLLWKTTPIEALSEHGELSFLGTWVSERLLGKELGFYIHQLPFAEQLVKRVSADGAMRRRDTPCEPESYTGRTPETPGKEFSEKEKAGEMHRLQSLVGSLIWLSCRTRPDLAYGVSMAASVITKSLEECHQRTRHLVQYLATHLSEGLFYRYGKEGETMDIYGDASFAPRGFCQ